MIHEIFYYKPHLTRKMGRRKKCGGKKTKKKQNREKKPTDFDVYRTDQSTETEDV